jgi:release factor glutamine methyltransferase
MLQRLLNAGIEESEARKEISILEKEIKDLNKIKEILDERIKTRKPLQYILGKAYFMDFEVAVNENVLIPRPETELLVGETVKRFGLWSGRRGLQTSPTVIDIGTGSGIIPIALAKALPNCKITAIDINKEIIELAKKNAIKNNVGNQINFKICDVFSTCFEGLINANKFDLIISNPPYVKDENLKSLSPEVQHEPKEALTGSKDNKSGLIYYERILEVVTANCHSRLDRESKNESQALDSHFHGNDKLLALEIDPLLVNDLKSLMNKHKIDKYEIVKDYSKLDRFLFISF